MRALLTPGGLSKALPTGEWASDLHNENEGRTKGAWEIGANRDTEVQTGPGAGPRKRETRQISRTGPGDPSRR